MMQNNNYKRVSREMPEDVKQKISASLRGRKKTPTHIANIAQGVKNYWEQIPKQQDGNDGHVTMDDIVL